MGSTQSSSSNKFYQNIGQEFRKRIKKSYRKIAKNKALYNITPNVNTMPRCSSFISKSCLHCQHRHMKKCCRYPDDSRKDAKSYAKWKTHFENPSEPIKPNCKLERQFPQVDSTPGVSEEWGSGWNGPEFIVEVQETELSTGLRHGETALNLTNLTEEGPKIIVRTEEVLIVGLVLVLWVGAIVLFFNRWGKIRMLEPYQPKFQQQHRSSCPLVDLDSLQSHPRASVSRMSMGMTGQLNIPACKFATYNPTIYAKTYTAYARPRQNSVFVGPQFLLPKPPRKTRSAMDLHSMVLDESAEHV